MNFIPKFAEFNSFEFDSDAETGTCNHFKRIGSVKLVNKLAFRIVVNQSTYNRFLFSAQTIGTVSKLAALEYRSLSDSIVILVIVLVGRRRRAKLNERILLNP